jgi:hypothetical protein
MLEAIAQTNNLNRVFTLIHGSSSPMFCWLSYPTPVVLARAGPCLFQGLVYQRLCGFVANEWVVIEIISNHIRHLTDGYVIRGADCDVHIHIKDPLNKTQGKHFVAKVPVHFAVQVVATHKLGTRHTRDKQ